MRVQPPVLQPGRLARKLAQAPKPGRTSPPHEFGPADRPAHDVRSTDRHPHSTRFDKETQHCGTASTQQPHKAAHPPAWWGWVVVLGCCGWVVVGGASGCVGWCWCGGGGCRAWWTFRPPDPLDDLCSGRSAATVGRSGRWPECPGDRTAHERSRRDAIVRRARRPPPLGPPPNRWRGASGECGGGGSAESCRMRSGIMPGGTRTDVCRRPRSPVSPVASRLVVFPPQCPGAPLNLSRCGGLASTAVLVGCVVYAGGFVGRVRGGDDRAVGLRRIDAAPL